MRPGAPRPREGHAAPKRQGGPRRHVCDVRDRLPPHTGRPGEETDRRHTPPHPAPRAAGDRGGGGGKRKKKRDGGGGPRPVDAHERPAIRVGLPADRLRHRRCGRDGHRPGAGDRAGPGGHLRLAILCPDGGSPEGHVPVPRPRRSLFGLGSFRVLRAAAVLPGRHLDGPPTGGRRALHPHAAAERRGRAGPDRDVSGPCGGALRRAAENFGKKTGVARARLRHVRLPGVRRGRREGPRTSRLLEAPEPGRTDPTR
mmetsp:Transcript_12139/g.24194  ORF Transcript_12139/g.24194 Transcript_12139/m.24194 type:complete len:256 (+) Transcript_12139:1014-1781(+)